MELTVALGGGGVKGYAHIGVLRVLEQEGFRIRAVAGTSIGGLIGAVYAAGYTPDEIERRLASLDQSQLFLRRPGDGPAMMGLAGVTDALEDALGDSRFEELKIPFAVTAVDMNTGQLLSIRRGLVIEAVLASIAVPGVFPPREWDGRMLVDGGVLDPVPVALARSMAPHLPVVAVVLSPRAREWIQNPTPRLLSSLPFLTKYLGRLRIAQALNIFFRSVDIAGATLTELRLQVDKPEVVVRPDTHDIGLIDQVLVEEVTRRGEVAASAAIPDLRHETSSLRLLGRRIRGREMSGDTGHDVA